MPIYEYRCGECNHEFEELMKVAEAPPPCTSCGASQVTRRVSHTSFVLKGGGWFKDGYSGASNQRASGESKPSAESSTKSDSNKTSSDSSSPSD